MPELRRSITLTQLIFYGLDTMVGGGFYALLGRVAGLASPLTPVALAVSGLLALLSAASFAELSARYPVSAGEVEYVWKGFNVQMLARTVGWLVIVTGVVSAATLAVATIGFLQDFAQVPEQLAGLSLVVWLDLIAGWGIGESVGVVFVITIIEVGALVVVGTLAGDSLTAIPDRWHELVPSATTKQWTGIMSGAFFAFYAFIGFEDMVNNAEEVKRPVAICLSPFWSVSEPRRYSTSGLAPWPSCRSHRPNWTRPARLSLESWAIRAGMPWRGSASSVCWPA